MEGLIVTVTRKEHPQKKKSKEWLSHSLIELMKIKPFKEITITEVSNHADLARRTFYRHFQNLDETLDFALQTLSQEFVLFIEQEKPVDFKEVIEAYFTFWLGYKEFLYILKKNHLLYLLLEDFFPYVRDRLSHTNSKEKKLDDQIAHDYLFSFSTGGIWNLLVKWLDDGALYSPKEMSEISIKLFDRPDWYNKK